MLIDMTQAQGADERHGAEAMSQQARKPPALVPGYEIEGLLGEGAFGEVWLALDGNTGIRVAIKFYTRRGVREGAALAAEVQKMAFLFGDRHVVQLIHVGWESSPPYFVMEHMPRGSLETRLCDGPLPVDEALALIRDVTVALVHAHGKGIFHCDLKPANVLLGPDGRARLADFGQSRLSHEHAPALGTLFYMAPEQADLATSPDARWDVYALGVLLYQMLTGNPPLGDQPDAAALRGLTSLEERLAAYRHLVQHAPRPAAHRKVHGVDRTLAEIVDRCLAPVPGRRFPNPQAVLDALDARALWRARRPLVALATMGPALLLVLVLTFFAKKGFDAAVAASARSLTAVTKDITTTLARHVAEQIARSVNLRWRNLRRVADDPAFRDLVAAATGKGRDSAEVAALQEALLVSHGAYKEQPPVRSWAVYDKDGVKLAATSFDPSNPTYGNGLGEDFSSSDFFHGTGTDDRRGTKPRPLHGAHLSTIYEDHPSKTRVVALSMPIWKGMATGPDQSRLGVLVMEVEVRSFADLLPQGDFQADLVVTLIDTRPDWTDKANVILGHPFMTQCSDEDEVPPEVPSHALQSSPRGWQEDYQDPYGQDNRAFDRRWFAASVPVVVKMTDPEGNPTGAQKLGWSVIVQQDSDVVTRPIMDLQQNLSRQGRYALGCVVLMVMALFGFLGYALSQSSRSRLTSFLRGRAGLASAGGTALTGRRSAGLVSDGRRTPANAGRETAPAEALDAHRSVSRPAIVRREDAGPPPRHAATETGPSGAPDPAAGLTVG
jgi:hypothetical protein